MPEGTESRYDERQSANDTVEAGVDRVGTSVPRNPVDAAVATMGDKAELSIDANRDTPRLTTSRNPDQVRAEAGDRSRPADPEATKSNTWACKRRSN